MASSPIGRKGPLEGETLRRATALTEDIWCKYIHGCSYSSGTVFSRCNIPFVPFDGTQFWARPPTRSMQVCKRPGRVIQQEIYFEKPGAAPQSANALRDIFCINLHSSLSLARAGQRGAAGVAAGCWVVGGARAGAAAGRAAAGTTAGRARGSQRPFTMRIFRALHLRTAARTLVFDTQMPSTS